MKSAYRLHLQTVDEKGDHQPRTSWLRNSYPLPDDIENAITQAEHNEERDSFCQSQNDVLIQQKRLIGWRTLSSISILDQLSKP